jgi:hypothetical protein
MLTINAFPPGQVQKEYCQAEAVGDVTGVMICTAVGKKQQTLCHLPRYADRSGLLSFQFESDMSGLGNN